MGWGAGRREVSETGLGLWLEELGLVRWGGGSLHGDRKELVTPTPTQTHTGSLRFSLQATLELQS